jgi:hypothetical protein
MKPQHIVVLYILAGMYCAWWFPMRIKQTLYFLQCLNKMAYDYGMRHLEEISEDRSLDPYVWFVKELPSFEACLFSFRPLKIERWIDSETIERINS